MRTWKFGDEMAAGVWGIREPKPDAPEVFPDILLVPLAAFDRVVTASVMAPATMTAPSRACGR